MPIPRRTLLLGAGAALALSACGADDDATPSADAPSGSAKGTFPATAKHRYGTTTVERQPERIVVVGLTEQDIVLALGYVPIATTEWYGEQPYAVWPWAQKSLGDAEPEVLSTADGLELEKIAALEPDLVIGVNAGMSEADYDRLSEFVPTIAGPVDGEDYFSSWKSQTLLIGDALGLPDEAQALVDDIAEQFAAARDRYPEFDGKSIVFLQNAVSDGSYIAYPDGLNTDFLTDLGFTVPAYLDPYTRDGAQSYIPAEKIDVVEDADALLWATEKASDIDALEDEATFTALTPVEDGRCAYTDGILAGAIYFTTPLSLPYLLERLPPLLSEALAGGVPREIADSTS